MEKRCIIIGAGDFNEVAINKQKEDLLIIADAGFYNYMKAKDYNIENIDILIGDFDSLNLNNDIKNKINNIITLDPIKDDTDILDAIKVGFKNGFTDFILYGVLGKRIEHTLGNISCLSFIKENHGDGLIIDNNTVLRVIENERFTFDDSFKGYFSMFSLKTISYGVNIHNMKYELNNYDVKECFPIGVDNEFIGKESYIEVKNGKLLLIYHN